MKANTSNSGLDGGAEIRQDMHPVVRASSGGADPDKPGNWKPLAWYRSKTPRPRVPDGQGTEGRPPFGEFGIVDGRVPRCLELLECVSSAAAVGRQSAV